MIHQWFPRILFFLPSKASQILKMAARRLHQKRYPVGYWSYVAWTGFWLWSQSKWIQSRTFLDSRTIFFTCGWNIFFFSGFCGWNMCLPWNVWGFLEGPHGKSLKMVAKISPSACFPPSNIQQQRPNKNPWHERGPCFIGPLVSYPSKMATWRVGVELNATRNSGYKIFGATQKSHLPPKMVV